MKGAGGTWRVVAGSGCGVQGGGGKQLGGGELPASSAREPFRGSSRLGPGAGTKESGDLNSGP